MTTLAYPFGKPCAACEAGDDAHLADHYVTDGDRIEAALDRGECPDCGTGLFTDDTLMCSSCWKSWEAWI